MKILRSIFFLALAITLQACHSFFQDEGDCEVTYRLSFSYDMNMKWADAFAHEVQSVHVWAFDDQGREVWSAVESGEQLAQPGYSIAMPLQPGRYKIVAWCGADNNPGDEDFVIDGDLSCRLERRYEAGVAVQDRDLHPLFHGAIEVSLPDLSLEGGEHTVSMPLMKDTNRLRVVLQHLSGRDVNVDDFDFAITAANGLMLADNSLSPDEVITYRPWGRFAGSAGVEINEASDTRAIENVAIARADFTLPRLTVEQRREVMLTITRRSDGATVARIPVIDYALLVKDLDSHGQISDQEYLDRQDSYSMMFFLDESSQWLASQIIINSWRVVLHDYDL